VTHKCFSSNTEALGRTLHRIEKCVSLWTLTWEFIWCVTCSEATVSRIVKWHKNDKHTVTCGSHNFWYTWCIKCSEIEGIFQTIEELQQLHHHSINYYYTKHNQYESLKANTVTQKVIHKKVLFIARGLRDGVKRRPYPNVKICMWTYTC
jgi:hypothetical protein